MESSAQFIKRKNEELKKEKLVGMKDIGREARHYFKHEAWTLMQQTGHPEKVFIIERLRRVEMTGPISTPKANHIGDIEYRIGYFMVGKHGNKKGRWTWGQYCPLIPQRDFNKLINLARKEGTLH
jgi:hypothetical protein